MPNCPSQIRKSQKLLALEHPVTRSLTPHETHGLNSQFPLLQEFPLPTLGKEIKFDEKDATGVYSVSKSKETEFYFRRISIFSMFGWARDFQEIVKYEKIRFC